MKYFRQETDYTCGPACVRMMLSNFDIESYEMELESLLETTSNSGTHYNQFEKIKDKFGLQMMKGETSNYASKIQLNDLQNLSNNGWVIMMAISLDVPHYVIFSNFNGSHIFLKDPFRGENVAEQAGKFLRRWKVIPNEFKKIAQQCHLNFEGIEPTYGWWIAFKK